MADGSTWSCRRCDSVWMAQTPTECPKCARVDSIYEIHKRIPGALPEDERVRRAYVFASAYPRDSGVRRIADLICNDLAQLVAENDRLRHREGTLDAMLLGSGAAVEELHNEIERWKQIAKCNHPALDGYEPSTEPCVDCTATFEDLGWK